MNLEEMWSKVDLKEDRLIERFRNTIGVDMVVPPGQNYDKLVCYLEGEFGELGF